MEDVVIAKRMAYRIGNSLPKPLRVVYYAILWLSFIYLFFRVTAITLKVTQKLGSTIFDEKHFYFLVFTIALIFTAIIIIAQFYFKLDPIGIIIDYILNVLNKIKTEIIDKIIVWLRTL